MSSLILEQSSIERLKAVDTGVEVRDSQGKLIGFFVPAITADEVDQYECHLSEEELQRRARDAGGRPLSEIMADLRKSS
jgi:hypothetical protein